MRYLGGNIYAKISWARLRTIAVNESSCINNLGSNQEGKKKKSWPMFIYLANKENSKINLGSMIKRVQFKHNNVFMNKLMSIRLNLGM